MSILNLLPRNSSLIFLFIILIWPSWSTALWAFPGYLVALFLFGSMILFFKLNTPWSIRFMCLRLNFKLMLIIALSCAGVAIIGGMIAMIVHANSNDTAFAILNIDADAYAVDREAFFFGLFFAGLLIPLFIGVLKGIKKPENPAAPTPEAAGDLWRTLYFIQFILCIFALVYQTGVNGNFAHYITLLIGIADLVLGLLALKTHDGSLRWFLPLAIVKIAAAIWTFFYYITSVACQYSRVSTIPGSFCVDAFNPGNSPFTAGGLFWQGSSIPLTFYLALDYFLLFNAFMYFTMVGSMALESVPRLFTGDTPEWNRSTGTKAPPTSGEASPTEPVYADPTYPTPAYPPQEPDGDETNPNRIHISMKYDPEEGKPSEDGGVAGGAGDDYADTLSPPPAAHADTVPPPADTSPPHTDDNPV